jgi:ABC-type Fe3+-hydroxamate transport system substrate-binding protein
MPRMRASSSSAIRKPASPPPGLWTFFGPGHPRTVALADRVSKESLRKLAAQRQARINGKKWKDDEDHSPEQIRRENVDNILARTSGFSPVNINGDLIEFSEQAAREMLLDRKKNWLLSQVMEYLGDEASFIQPSATA